MIVRKPEQKEEPSYSGDPFSEEERRALRKMIEQEKYVKWFWASVRQWAAWAAALVAGVVVFRENLKALVQWFIK